jgi:transcriptional regulator with XRE-family HTH domain
MQKAGEIIKKRRLMLGISQSEFASLLGISSPAV